MRHSVEVIRELGVWCLPFPEFLPGQIIFVDLYDLSMRRSFCFANGINRLKPVNTTHPSLMLRIQPVWHNAGSSMNSCQTVPRPSGSVRTYPRSGIADIESTERYRQMRWVTMICWELGCCPCWTCETHSCSRAPRGGKLLSGAEGMRVGSWRPPLGFVFRFRRKKVEAQ